jgi:hypothetical protein
MECIYICSGSGLGAASKPKTTVRPTGTISCPNMCVRGTHVTAASRGKRGLPTELSRNTNCVGCEIIKHHLSVCTNSHLNQDANNKCQKQRKVCNGKRDFLKSMWTSKEYRKVGYQNSEL